MKATRFCAAIGAAMLLIAPLAHAGYVSSPAPQSFASQVLWDLAGYGSYGLEGAADVLYSGESHSYTLAMPDGVEPGRYLINFWVIGDDHYAVPTTQYEMQFHTNAGMGGIWPIQHGAPFGTRFADWSRIGIYIDYSGGPVQFRIDNLSTAGARDWVAIDRVALSLAPVPEPETALLLAAGLAVGGLTRKRLLALKE